MSDLPIARGYSRVSTHMQSDDGISLNTQEKRIKEYCQYKHLNLVKIYEDRGISGKDTDNRPALQQLLNELKRGEYMIVCDLSRFSRNTIQSLSLFKDLDERGIKFVCLTPDIDFSTPVGGMMMTILMAFYQLERLNISANVSTNLKTLSKSGKLRSRCPFGYIFVNKDRDLEPEPEQQAVIEKIKQMFIQHMKYAQIAKKLNEDGDNKCLLNNKKNKSRDPPKFYAETIKCILQDHGLVESDRKSIDERIVSHHKSK